MTDERTSSSLGRQCVGCVCVGVCVWGVAEEKVCSVCVCECDNSRSSASKSTLRSSAACASVNNSSESTSLPNWHLDLCFTCTSAVTFLHFFFLSRSFFYFLCKVVFIVTPCFLLLLA